MEAKKIIITGGATRIGAAIARSLANYETSITIHFNTSKKEAEKVKKELQDLGSEVHLIKADLSSQKQTENLIKNAFKKMKGIDCLVNNASVVENDDLLNFYEKSFLKHSNNNIKEQSIITSKYKKKKPYGLAVEQNEKITTEAKKPLKGSQMSI